MSQSTRLLRSKLAALGVAFTMPLDTSGGKGSSGGGEAGAPDAHNEEAADSDLCDEARQVR